MPRKPDIAQLRHDLVDAFEWGEEERARAALAQLAAQPRQARAVLEEMLASPDAAERRAAAFGLGELGGAASLKRLEQQMTIEEARDDYDGASVLEVIIQALGHLKEAGARATLLRKLRQLIAKKRPPSEMDDMAYALWCKRHPEQIPVIQSALELYPSEDLWRLRALLQLLEIPPEALGSWLLDTSTSLKVKTKILTLLDEEVPDDLLPVIPAFIAVATALGDAPVNQDGEASYYCNRLFTTLMLHDERILPALPVEARAALRTLARRCVASVDSSCSLRAASMLHRVGRPEDVPLLEAHRPASPILAEVFDEAIHALRKLPNA